MDQPVTIQRQKDGRHAVIDGAGKVMGMHKSVWSAARQVHEYAGLNTPGDIHPPVPRPEIPKVSKKEQGRPPSDRPSIPKP